MAIINVGVSESLKEKLKVEAKKQRRSLRAHVEYILEKRVENVTQSSELIPVGKVENGPLIYDPKTPAEMTEFLNIINDCQERRKRGEDVVQPVLIGYKK